MINYSYWPYDEVSLETEPHNNILKVTTPWLHATTKLNFFNPEAIATLCDKFQTGSLSADDLPLVNNFFRHFHTYPLAYILPFPKHQSHLDKHALIDTVLLAYDLPTLADHILADPDSNVNEHERATFLGMIGRTEWMWDKDAALDFASINQHIHPESFFSVARRFHILELLSSDAGNHIMENLQNLNPEEYRTAVSRLVRQNHYITEQCQAALQPAEAIAQSAEPLVRAFREEERGHDKILAKALFHMGTSPETIEVTIQTRALMAILKFMARRNFLAFSMAVDAFERNNYQDVDPLAQMLIRGGFNKAAEFANLHMKINDDGGHENVAQQFLGSMDLCPKDYALEALRLMELLSLTMSTISQSAYTNRDFL